MRRRVYAIAAAALAAALGAAALGADPAAATPAREEKIYFTCPISVRVGAKDLPEGWNAVASATLMFVEAQTIEQSRLLMCTYRSKELGEHSVMRIAPEGYGCRLSTPGGQSFVCARRPKAPVRIK